MSILVEIVNVFKTFLLLFFGNIDVYLYNNGYIREK